MYRKELVRRVASVMRERGIKKPITFPKQVFHISDDYGNTRDFVIKRTDKSVVYTIEDIEAILDGLIYVAEEALKRGENVSIRGFGTLCLHYRKAHAVKHVATGEDTFSEARYVPKFLAGSGLKIAAKMYATLLSNLDEPLLPLTNDECDDEEEDGE